MANLIQELAERFNLQSRKLQAWGTIDGYWFQISLAAASAKITLVMRTALDLADEAVSKQLGDALSAYARETPAFSYSVTGSAVTLERKANALKAQEAEEMLHHLTGLFRTAGAVPACFHCGKEQPESFALVNGTAMKLCSECQAAISGQIEQGAQEHAEAKNRYIPGLIGALIGALIGSIAWVVIGMLNYLAAIGGVAIAFCAAKGYTLMKGKVTVVSIVLICLICIVVMVFAQFVTETIGVINELKDMGYDDVNVIDAAAFTWDIIKTEPEAQGGFLKNCGLGLLFLGLGSYSVIKSLAVKAKAPSGTFERL